MPGRLLALLLLAVPARAAEPALPPSIDVHGESLRLVSCGVREILWVDIYSAGLYLRPSAPPDAATDPGEPAALSIVVHSPMHFPFQLPDKWRRALHTGLDADGVERVVQAYQALREGDRLSVEYLPGSGVTLYTNGKRIVASGGHRLIAGLLEAWSAGSPVAEKVRRTATKHPC